MTGLEDDSDEEDTGSTASRSRLGLGSGLNDHVRVIPPEGDQEEVLACGDHQAAIKPEVRRGDEAPPQALPGGMNGKARVGGEIMGSAVQVEEPESMFQPGEEDEDATDPRVPGSFDLTAPNPAHGPGVTWGDLFRRLTT